MTNNQVIKGENEGSGFDIATGGFSLGDSNITMRPIKFYDLDMSKINTLEDMKNVIASLNIKVCDGCDNFESLKPYIKEEE